MGYNNEVLYFKIESSARTRAQIVTLIGQLDDIIDALLNQALISISGGNIVEYEIDTGQSKNKVKYSDSSQVQSAITKYESLRTYYQNKLVPRQIRAIPGKNMNSRNR